jgi:hypothetical protein
VVFLKIGGTVQAEIMEYCINAFFFEEIYKPGSIFQIIANYIKHVAIFGRIRWNKRPLQKS